MAQQENFSESTKLIFFRFKGFKAKYIAISLMGFSKIFHSKSPTAKVDKILGTGSGLGFSRRPNFGQYVQFKVDSIWNHENWIFRALKRHSFERVEITLNAYQSKGKWDGNNPYPDVSKSCDREGRVAILTRAKVKPRFIYAFWKHVGPSNKQLTEVKGRIFSAGMGEWPFSHPITFSVWESLDHAKAYAYGNTSHGNAAKAARDGGWFKEDLFVRYSVSQLETIENKKSV